MGKIQSKYGSYDAEKYRKKQTQKANEECPVYIHKLPDNLIYQDKRATSFIQPKAMRIVPKRPMTFIQTKSEYNALRDNIKKSEDLRELKKIHKEERVEEDVEDFTGKEGMNIFIKFNLII